MGSHCGQANVAIFLCILAVVLAEQATGTTTTTQAPPSKKELKIAAFNVQVFGVTKMKKTEVVEVLVRIIRRYDVILIQEIRDASGEAIIELLEEINDSEEHNYEITLSERLGRTSSKEQYAFLYRSGIGLDVVSTYQYPDKADKFERPPFAILLKIPNSDIKQMALIAIHTSPKEAEAEIDALVDVRLAVMKQWRINNVLIMGDFNAASPYTTKTEMAKIRLRDSKYLWLIPDDMDTTISRSDSAYDRFVVTGKELTNSIVPDSAKTFRFNEAYKLDLEESKDVSDHFPIEFAIKLGTSGSTSAGNRKRGFISRVKEFARGLFSSDHHEL